MKNIGDIGDLAYWNTLGESWIQKTTTCWTTDIGKEWMLTRVFRGGGADYAYQITTAPPQIFGPSAPCYVLWKIWPEINSRQVKPPLFIFKIKNSNILIQYLQIICIKTKRINSNQTFKYGRKGKVWLPAEGHIRCALNI